MKLYQSSRLYVKMDNKFRWLVSPEIATKVVGVDWEKQVREYVDDQNIFNTLGKPISEWPEVEPEVEIRKMCILGTCLPGCETMWEDLRGTHFYGNRYYWPNHDEVERLGMKSFINVRADEGELTEAIIKERVNEWKNRSGCGGYWSDQLGHEPDICNQPMEKRIWFYDMVRKYDPDKQNHPVMEMFDMTRTGDFPPEQHQGWKLAWSDLTHDLMLVDCYPDMRQSKAKMIEGMTEAWDDMINKYAHKNQVIIQMIANEHYQPGKIRVQYEFWKEKMASAEFANPYRGRIGVCFYHDITIRPNEEMKAEIREVNKEVMTGG